MKATRLSAAFVVVTVVAMTPATSLATVTETDKPDRLQITRATPQVHAAPRTAIANP